MKHIAKKMREIFSTNCLLILFFAEVFRGIFLYIWFVLFCIKKKTKPDQQKQQCQHQHEHMMKFDE